MMICMESITKTDGQIDALENVQTGTTKLIPGVLNWNIKKG